jgi:MoxR-like ATPase
MTNTTDATLLETPGISVADFREPGDLLDSGDRRDGRFYRYTPEVKLAVRIALAVHRPLLVFGPSGCGKSSLVFNLARVLRRRYYELVVNSRSEAQDLYYRFDAVRRLGEAQLGAAAGSATEWRCSYAFIEPGPLWWVYSPETARRRGSSSKVAVSRLAIDPGRWPDAYAEPGKREGYGAGPIPPAVLLIDEIDKADPDFPNNLLVPLGSGEFTIDQTGDLIGLGNDRDATPPLIIITSNRERELPVAFVRRCIVLQIQPFSNEELIDLTLATFRDADESRRQTWRSIAEKLQQIHGYAQVSPAEFLDTVRAIEHLQAQDSEWDSIILRTSWTTNMAARD